MLRLLCCLLLPLAPACLWDSDTVRDEARLRPDLWELVSGQVPVHGEAYYRARVARLMAMPAPTREQRNDLAVAWIRLGDLAAADAVLAELRREDPGEYLALSNQAVLRRNQGDFAAAIPLFEQALRLKPEGHLGLGDWTLRAVRYRQRVSEDAALAQSEDFLGRPRPPHLLQAEGFRGGIPWDEMPEPRRRLFDQLILLLRNDRRFADGYFVLGDELVRLGDNNLAVYAYARAKALGHPAPVLLEQRLENQAGQVERWYRAGVRQSSPAPAEGGPDAPVLPAVMATAAAAASEEIQRELALAAAWNQRFAVEEAIAVAAGREPAIEDTLAILRAKGVEPHLPLTADDRLRRMKEVWSGALDLAKRKQWPAAEREFAKAKAMVEADAKGSNDHGRLLIGYAASLAPQGGKAKLDAAAAELLAAEAIFRAEADPDRQNLDMTLRNLEVVFAALTNEAGRLAAAKRRAELPTH